MVSTSLVSSNQQFSCGHHPQQNGHDDDHDSWWHGGHIFWKSRDDDYLIWWWSWPWWQRIFIFCIHMFLSNHKIYHKLVYYQRPAHNYRWTCCGWFGESLRTSVLDRALLFLNFVSPRNMFKNKFDSANIVLISGWGALTFTFFCFHTIQYHDISIIPNSDLLRFFPSPSGWRQVDMKNIKGKGYWMLMIYQGRVLWSGNFSCLLALQWNWNC